MITAMPDNRSALSIYLDYDYLTARQLGGLLLDMHGVFDGLLYIDAPWLRHLKYEQEASLRISAVDTTSSVTVYLVQGITQVVGSADPGLVATVSGVAALTTMGTLMLRMLNRAEELRAKFLQDNRANEARQLELKEKRLALQGQELKLSARAELERGQRVTDAKAVLAEQYPGLSPAQRDALSEQLWPHLESILELTQAENVRRIEITLPETGPEPVR
jgi:hypothetical protein